MIVSVVKDLASNHSKEELDNAAVSFEKSRDNVLDVDGKDDGEKLSNLLAASHVRARMDKGMTLSDALREHSQRMRSVLIKSGGFPKKSG